MAQFLRNFYPPISPFTGQSRGSRSGTGSVPVDERKATYRRASFFQNNLPRFLLWYKDVLVTPNKKKKCDRKVNRFSSSIKIARISSSTRLDIHSSFSLSLSPSLEISSLFNFGFVFFLFDFFVLRFDWHHTDHRRWSTIVDRQRHVKSFWRSHGRKVARSNIPMYLCVLGLFFFSLYFFSQWSSSGRRAPPQFFRPPRRTADIVVHFSARGVSMISHHRIPLTHSLCLLRFILFFPKNPLRS